MAEFDKRFYDKVLPLSCGCHVWLACRNKKGYGLFQVGRRSVHAHRVAYALMNGDIPDGMFVCHMCDNPCCVNPDHLFLGTHDDNMRDMVSKGRSLRRLTKEQVTEIIERYDRGGVTQRELAAEYGVSYGVVNYALANYRL